MELELLVAKQQQQIEALQEALARAKSESANTHRFVNEAFLKLDKLATLRLRDCWKDDKKMQWDSYLKIIHETKAFMQDAAWCFSCQSFCCDHDGYPDQ